MHPGEGGPSANSLSDEGRFAEALWPPVTRGAQPRRPHTCKAKRKQKAECHPAARHPAVTPLFAEALVQGTRREAVWREK